MYTYTDLINDVKKEAEALRREATAKERANLDFKELDVISKRSCIYGQMTGNCFSRRASSLIYKCTPRYFKDTVMVSDEEDLKDVTVDSLLKHVNGNKVKGFVKERSNYGDITHYSAIEAYILLPEARNATLIAYLRGETETLDL